MSGFEAPNNGIYIVLGEINLLLANLKKANAAGNSNSSNDDRKRAGEGKYYDQYYGSDPLTRNFYELKTLLNDHCGKYF